MGVEPPSRVIDDKDVKVQYGIISTKTGFISFFRLAKPTTTCENIPMKKRSLITALALGLLASSHLMAAEKTLRIGNEAA